MNIQDLDPQHRLLFKLLTAHFDAKLSQEFQHFRKVLISDMNQSFQSMLDFAVDRLDEKVEMLDRRIEDTNNLIQQHIRHH